MERIKSQETSERRWPGGEAGVYVLHHFGYPAGLIREVDNYIYLLRDPRDESARYVGRTKNPKRRYGSHLHDKCDGSYIRARWHWISELCLVNLRPQMEIIETLCAPIDEALVSEREFRWIFHFFQQGANLTNVDCIRMPRLYSAAKLSQIDFLNEPLDSLVWERLALLKSEDHAEWMRTNRELDEMKKVAAKIQKRKERQSKNLKQKLSKRKPPNNSLDRSGGSVVRIKLGAARVE